MGKQAKLDDRAVDRIIEMAWEDRTPFDAIQFQFGLNEGEVIALMRREMTLKSWKMWRKRVQGRATKHQKKSVVENFRFKSSRQKQISMNKISKRPK